MIVFEIFSGFYKYEENSEEDVRRKKPADMKIFHNQPIHEIFLSKPCFSKVIHEIVIIERNVCASEIRRVQCVSCGGRQIFPSDERLGSALCAVHI